MSIRNFYKSGHWPTLLGSFLYFDVSFMVWVLLGATGIYVAQDLQLTTSQKGFMVALPILGGSFMRIVMGFLADRIGAKRSAIMGMILTLVPLFLLWMFGTTLYEVYAYGFLLGIAGASFAVALPLASRWYPPHYQGLALGIAGAGNSGTVFATLFAPRLAEYFGGWHAVFGLAMIPVGLVLFCFIFMAKDAPNQPAPKSLKEYATVLHHKDTWLFCFLYSITFGGFVGMVSFLPIFFDEQYSLTKIASGDFVTLCVIAGSFCRPIGGFLADKWGGVRILQALFFSITALFVLVSMMFSFRIEMILLIFIMAGFGLGNGAVFQLVPQRFAKEIGVVTGIVGAAGGVGGFFLPSLLGVLKDITGTYTMGFATLAFVVALALIIVVAIRQYWDQSLPLRKTPMKSTM